MSVNEIAAGPHARPICGKDRIIEWAGSISEIAIARQFDGKAAAALAATSLAIPMVATSTVSQAQISTLPPKPTECGSANRYCRLPGDVVDQIWNIQRDTSNNPKPRTNPYVNSLFDYSEFDLENDTGRIYINPDEVDAPTVFTDLDMFNMSTVAGDSPGEADDLIMDVARIEGEPAQQLILALWTPALLTERQIGLRIATVM